MSYQLPILSKRTTGRLGSLQRERISIWRDGDAFAVKIGVALAIANSGEFCLRV
jgi:hypothetical protein